jgi:hypothetical protein
MTPLYTFHQLLDVTGTKELPQIIDNGKSDKMGNYPQ